MTVNGNPSPSSKVVFWVPVVVSVLALAASLTSLWISYGQSTTAREQLEDQEGKLLSSAYVDLYDPAAHALQNSQALINQPLRPEDFQSHDVYIVMDVSNIGNRALAIKGAGLIVDDHKKLVVAQPLCTQPGTTGDMSPCKLPIKLPVAADAYVYLRVDDVKDQISCSQYVHNVGITGAVQTADGRIWPAKTQTLGPSSSNCPGTASSSPRETPSPTPQPGATTVPSAMPSG